MNSSKIISERASAHSLTKPASHHLSSWATVNKTVMGTVVVHVEFSEKQFATQIQRAPVTLDSRKFKSQVMTAEEMTISICVFLATSE